MANNADSRHKCYERDPGGLPDGDPLGTYDIAGLLGITRSGAFKWIERGALPPADGPWINGYPTWRRETILAWAMETERAPEEVREEWREVLAARAKADRLRKKLSSR